MACDDVDCLGECGVVAQVDSRVLVAPSREATQFCSSHRETRADVETIESAEKHCGGEEVRLLNKRGLLLLVCMKIARRFVGLDSMIHKGSDHFTVFFEKVCTHE